MILSSIYCDVWLYYFDTTEGYSYRKTYLIEQKHQIIVVNMLQNWNNKYSSYYMIIKYIGLEQIIYTINLDAASFSIKNSYLFNLSFEVSQSTI